MCALLNGGGYAEYAAVHKDHILHLKKDDNIADMASVPEALITAFMLIKLIGNVK